MKSKIQIIHTCKDFGTATNFVQMADQSDAGVHMQRIIEGRQHQWIKNNLGKNETEC